MTNINSLRDERTGRFQTTTDTTVYKMVQFNNKRMSEHARVVCIALNIPQIPKSFIIHHLDENKRNNDINNLALITITAHNRIHAHEPWNKGKKFDDNIIFKQRQAREITFLKKAEETYKLHLTGLKNIEISNIQGITRGAVSYRINKIKEKYGK